MLVLIITYCYINMSYWWGRNVQVCSQALFCCLKICLVWFSLEINFAANTSLSGKFLFFSCLCCSEHSVVNCTLRKRKHGILFPTCPTLQKKKPHLPETETKIVELKNFLGAQLNLSSDNLNGQKTVLFFHP